MRCPLGVPLLPLYTRGAGLQERFPNRLRVGVLIGYNYISSCTRKIGSIPTPLEASWSFARRTVLMESAGISSARPTLSGRVHFGPPRGYPGVIFPTDGEDKVDLGSRWSPLQCWANRPHGGRQLHGPPLEPTVAPRPSGLLLQWAR